MHCLRRSRRRGRRSRGETLTSKQPSLRRRLLPVTAGMRACHVRTCCPVGHIMYILSACSHLTPGYDPINISSALSSPPYQRWFLVNHCYVIVFQPVDLDLVQCNLVDLMVVFRLFKCLIGLKFYHLCSILLVDHQIVLSWYYRRPESHQQSFTNMS